LRWHIAKVPLDFDLSRAQSGLEYLDQPTFEGYPIVGRWKPLYIFGEERYAEGGGAISSLCVSAVSGAVVGLDIEREGESLFFLNSDLPKFIATFNAFDRAFQRGSTQASSLIAEGIAIDQSGFTKSEWYDLAEVLVVK
jgi:hypothetical protein